ncbi:ribonuclease HII [Thiomicrorhabdus sp. zzn3]|uniref:ribonuclease HII n=1 Tax=Thiomicrorhabdus sp. zzn3 TaxID=3039775 RepID=UPI00243670D1|nr:ribonuclease HII [Thiomicrorhabdus sp. zzn3]MDG6777989.1 ribonuclease HII [Thiomicrorhabdus sp. zzn3]
MKINRQSSLFELSELDALQPDGAIIGVDEVGRGPLIGEVVAAAVVLPDSCTLPLADSKKLNESRRIELAEQIKNEAIAYSIASATPEEIDHLNILNATMLAMQRAIRAVACQVESVKEILVDGNRCPKTTSPCRAIVKGDDKVAQISAASILAKVYRDQQMMEMDQRYPQYGFAQHKGYPTSKHLEAIQEHGLISGYRKSFKPIKRLLESTHIAPRNRP